MRTAAPPSAVRTRTPSDRSERTDEKVLGIVELVYGTVDSPTRWNEVISTTGQLVGATKGGLHRFDHAHLSGSSFHDWNVDPAFSRSYASHYSQQNPRAIRGGHLLAPGQVVSSADLCPDDLMLKSAFANEWLLPQQIFHSLGITLSKEEEATWSLTFFRSREQGPFADEAIRRLSSLAPHFERAIQLGNRIAEHASQAAVLLESIDRIDIGIILLDRLGRVLHANRIANELASDRDGIRVTSNALSSELPGPAAALRSTIAGALDVFGGEPNRGGGTVLLDRSNGKRPLSLLVVPYRAGPATPVPGSPAAIVFLTDPESNPTSLADYLRRHFHLTPSECRLVAELLAFRSVGEATERLDISVNTARTHLKRILSKTGSRTQAELLRLLMKSIPALIRS